MPEGIADWWRWLAYAVLVATVAFLSARIGDWRRRRAEVRKLGPSFAAQAERARTEPSHAERTAPIVVQDKVNHLPSLRLPMIGLAGGTLIMIGAGPLPQIDARWSMLTVVQMGAGFLAISCASRIGAIVDRWLKGLRQEIALIPYGGKANVMRDLTQ
ncbi:MAG TPA: hypothetical protein VEI03_20100 [Stellaceae bacterium]|nr:hypothetical protein [Stellaceae bacterium]